MKIITYNGKELFVYYETEDYYIVSELDNDTMKFKIDK